MTVSSNEIQNNDPFVSLYPHQFMLLTTFRKSGEAVPTTVWFAQDGVGRIYLTTGSGAGKLKRIRNNHEVQMVPSDRMGTVVDGQGIITGYARQAAPEEYEQAEASLMRKYGEQYAPVIARLGANNPHERTYIEIRAEKE